MDDLARLRLPIAKLRPFVLAADHHPGATLDSSALRKALTPKPVQHDLFG